MAGMTGKTIAATYHGILKTAGDNVNIPTGSTGVNIVDGEETVTALYLTDGEVGIGIATPANILHVSGTSSTPVAIQRDSASGAMAIAQWKMGDSASATAGQLYGALVGGITTNTNGSEDGYFAIEVTDGGVTGSSSEKMRILGASGNVGIGTATPNFALEVSDSAEVIANFESSDRYSSITIQDNSDKAYAICDGTDNLMSLGMGDHTNLTANLNIHSSGKVGIGTATPDARLEIGGVADGVSCHISQTEGTLTSNDVCLELEFDNNVDNDPDGLFLDCRTVGGSAREQRFKMDSMGVLYSFTTSITDLASDERLKKDMEDYTGGLAIVNSLKPKTFKYKEGHGDGSGNLRYGFVSQDIQSIEGIKEEMQLYTSYKIEDDHQSKNLLTDGVMNTTSLGSTECFLISAIKELSAKVEALENNNKQGDSSNEQEQQEQSEDSGDSGGDASGESSGEDSEGTEGSSSDSSSSTSGTSEASESSSDDGGESSGSSGSDDSDDSEAGSGGDDSSGSEGESSGDGRSLEPSESWTKNELKEYMDANEIVYNSGDTKQDLLDKIGLTGGS